MCECDNLTFLKSPSKCALLNESLKSLTNLVGRGFIGKNAKPLPRRLALDGKHACENSDIQRGLTVVRAFLDNYIYYPVSNCTLWQEIEIKRGAFGLGAFAVTAIRKGQFIGGTYMHFSTYLPMPVKVTVTTFTKRIHW